MNNVSHKFEEVLFQRELRNSLTKFVGKYSLPAFRLQKLCVYVALSQNRGG